MELKIENLSKCYGKKQVLSELTTTLTEGIYGILGPNGAGKTTLIRIIIGILQATSGEVYLNGVNVKKMGSSYLDQIGYLPQYPIFYKNFTVDEFLNYMGTLKDLPKEKVKAKIDEVLALVNLTQDKKKRISALSGGMRQRLGIAQAILNDPKILVLDEPTAGLDPGERIRFRNLISKLSKNRIVLLTTHIVPDVEYMAKEILIIKAGKLVQKGKVEELTQSIDGFVWQIDISEELLSEWSDRYLISNVKREADKLRLRIINEEKPDQAAITTTPTLEDVFLFVFGGLT